MISLKRIDLYLIRRVQWTIRQLELFTPVSRRAVGTLFAVISLFAVVATATLIFVTMKEGEYADMFVFWVMFFCLFATHKDLGEELRGADPVLGKTHIDGNTRTLRRRILVIVSTLLLGYFTLRYFGAGESKRSVMLQSYFICIPFVNMTAIEYFFCTKSISEKVEGK